MEDFMTVPQPDSTVEVVDIQFRVGQKVYYFDPAGFVCKLGDHVIIDTARGGTGSPPPAHLQAARAG